MEIYDFSKKVWAVMSSGKFSEKMERCWKFGVESSNNVDYNSRMKVTITIRFYREMDLRYAV